MKAALLLAIFLSAGTSLPSLDALAHHQETAERSQSHIEPAGGCLSHGGHCGLGRTAPGSGAALSLTSTSHAQSDSETAPTWHPFHILFSADRGGSPQSRAPPAPLA